MQSAESERRRLTPASSLFHSAFCIHHSAFRRLSVGQELAAGAEDRLDPGELDEPAAGEGVPARTGAPRAPHAHEPGPGAVDVQRVAPQAGLLVAQDTEAGAGDRGDVERVPPAFAVQLYQADAGQQPRRRERVVAAAGGDVEALDAAEPLRPAV